LVFGLRPCIISSSNNQEYLLNLSLSMYLASSLPLSSPLSLTSLIATSNRQHGGRPVVSQTAEPDVVRPLLRKRVGFCGDIMALSLVWQHVQTIARYKSDTPSRCQNKGRLGLRLCPTYTHTPAHFGGVAAAEHLRFGCENREPRWMGKYLGRLSKCSQQRGGWEDYSLYM
jgi:hypothetical protein